MLFRSGTNGVGANVIYSVLNQSNALGFGATPNQVRASNMIGYFLPSNLGGFYGQLQYGLHENMSTSTGTMNGRSGQYAGGRLGYANGPVDVAVAYGESRGFTGAAGGGFVSPEVRTFNIGASYDFGVVKLFGEASDVRFEQDFMTGASAEDKQYGYLLGVSAPVGAGVVKAAWSAVRRDREQANLADPKAGKLALGYVHNLSKRTALYATVARVTSKNGYNLGLGGGVVGNPTGADAKRSVTGYDFGVRHAF